MKNPRRLAFALLALLTVSLVTALCFAQDAPAPLPAPVPASLPPGVVLVALIGIAVGFLNQAVQTGKVLGNIAVAASLLPWLVTAGTFLGGALAYMQSLPSPVAITSATIVGALIAGGFALTAGLTPGVVAHHFGARVNADRPLAVSKWCATNKEQLESFKKSTS